MIFILEMWQFRLGEHMELTPGLTDANWHSRDPNSRLCYPTQALFSFLQLLHLSLEHHPSCFITEK